MNARLSAGAMLGIAQAPAIVAVVGCGGKTTFIESLARAYGRKKVLISPTAKILPPQGRGVVLRETLAECRAHAPQNGIQCLGLYNNTNGKLEALPPGVLAEIAPQYDLVLLEADGSRGLPCKGWRSSEPVIPPFCTHTVGIVTLNALGKPADARCVLNLAEFLRLTGLAQGDTICRQALEDMVCAAQGMFRNAVGRQCLFVNQAEDEQIAAAAASWLGAWRKKMPNRFFCLAYGSAKENIWTEV